MGNIRSDQTVIALFASIAAFVCIGMLAAFTFSAFADEAEKPLKIETATPDPVIVQAALAIRLANQGEEVKSPILMLAAIEILGELKTGDPPKEFAKQKKKESNNQGPLSTIIDINDWEDKAREYAKSDKAMIKLVDQFIESNNSRGLAKKPYRAKRFNWGNSSWWKIEEGDLERGESAFSPTLVYKGHKHATIAVIGDPHSDFRIGVEDSKGNSLFGPSFRGWAMCSWSPRVTDRYHITVINDGPRSSFILITN